MGAIRNTINSLDPSEDVAAGQKELIEALAQLAEAKADFFDLEIQESLQQAGTANKTVPIEAILDSRKETHAFSSTASTLILDRVTSSIKDFIAGGQDNVINGVANLLSTAITAFMGEGTANSSTLERYYVMTEGYSIVRIDVKCWYQSIIASGISQHVQKVSAFVGVKSAVDLTAVKFNTFLNLYQRQLNSANMAAVDVQSELEKAREIYDLLRPDSKSLIVQPLNVRNPNIS